MATLSRLECLLLLVLKDCFLVTLAQTTSTVTGSQIQLNCRYTASKNGEAILWYKKNPQLALSNNIQIHDKVPTELKQRLSITGDHSNGEYNLMISGIKKSDEGNYECNVYGGISKVQIQTLVVIDGPTGLNIKNKQENKLLGTEGQYLTITCTATGGDPAPNMTLLIGNGVYRANNQHTIEKTVAKISRDFDGATVTCEASYEGVTYAPMTDTAVIELYLKPLTPSFSMEPIVTENVESLVLTCTSTGSRPSPTERIWRIGDSNVDISSNSTPLSSSYQSDRTFTATSKLTYKVNKIYNQQNITCGFKNTAFKNFVLNSKKMNVKYAPLVTVQNKTFTLTQTSRVIQCVADGNPVITFSGWEHISKYGELIRNLDGGNTLVLPQHPEGIRYQDTGEYICIVNNGIRDERGNLNQRGSGHVISQAPPRFLNGYSQTKFGQYGKDVNIEVSVYSEPKYRTPIWLKDGRPLLQSHKYTMSDVSDVITDAFYSTKIQIDGFRVTLTVENLAIDDFVNYSLRLSNGIGGPEEHRVVLLSSSPPETPVNFTVTCSTDSTVKLQWLPTFDGGHEQTFYVEYRKAVSNNWEITSVPKESKTLHDKLQSYELQNLKDSTWYEIRMYAQNRFNQSLPTPTKVINTKGKHRDVECKTMTVAVGLSIVTVISIVINGIQAYFTWTGKQASKKTAQYLDSSDKQSNPEVYYNITETHDYNTDIDTSNYETLGTKDKPNLYEDFEQTGKATESKLYSNTMV